MCARQAVVLSSKQRSSGRRFVAIDIENICGGAVVNKELAEVGWQEVARAVGLIENEQVVVGVGPSSLLAAGLGCSSARRVMGRGLSGADHALIDVLRDERIADRFDEVVIASGDGIFAEIASLLSLEGVHVTVVARHGHLSKRLRLAAGEVVLLADDDQNLGEVA